MQDKTLNGQGKRFIKSENAAHYPQFDLLGEARRAATLCARLNHLNTYIADQLGAHCRHLFNDNNIQISLSTWQETDVSADHWLGASPNGKGDALVAMGFSRSDLFSLSELFFGGQLAAVKQVDSRQVTDTEERLAQKMLHCLLGACFSKLDLSLEGWQSQWFSRKPQGKQICTEVRLNVGEGTVRWCCCWAADFEPHPKTPVLLPEQLSIELKSCAHTVPVKLKIAVAELSMNLGELSQLKSGDILPIDLSEQVTARIGKITCLRGQIAEQGEQLVLRVSESVGEVT
ncbi:FliM/FliN family flagellar motor switch protein [Gallaecimonas mangrovi]|uniref:FliM/FliN family flagellar motor switch protein n=1 Tax=Gallaecimonas mangrovi TaxID=2291597 RepID=UPI000E205B45|nr:FliM/FliN family flagellar motor switch protein [Gallaecimonas mangrovi]